MTAALAVADTGTEEAEAEEGAEAACTRAVTLALRAPRTALPPCTTAAEAATAAKAPAALLLLRCTAEATDTGLAAMQAGGRGTAEGEGEADTEAEATLATPQSWFTTLAAAEGAAAAA